MIRRVIKYDTYTLWQVSMVEEIPGPRLYEVLQKPTADIICVSGRCEVVRQSDLRENRLKEYKLEMGATCVTVITNNAC